MYPESLVGIIDTMSSHLLMWNISTILILWYHYTVLCIIKQWTLYNYNAWLYLGIGVTLLVEGLNRISWLVVIK